MSYRTPGVYVEEISLLPASVAGVETAIPAFIGYTQRAENSDTGENLRMVPTRITSLLEYRQLFGGANPVRFDFSIEDDLDEDGNLAERSFSAAVHESANLNFKLFQSLQLYFANGGGPCYIVSVGGYGGSIAAGDDENGLIGGIHALEKVDEPTLLLFPDAVSLTNTGDFGSVVTTALDQCFKLKDRFTIIDRYVSHDNTPVTDEQFRTAMGMNNLNYGAVYHPFLKTTLNHEVNEETSLITHTDSEEADGQFNSTAIGSIKTDHPAVYRSLMARVRDIYVKLPPSGAIAGVYARVDRNRGVWKAPANVSLNAVIEPVLKINDEMQAGLNVDAATGKSINVIRSFTGKGTLVWGARTLAGNDNEWRYIPVRRLFIYVEESVKKATEFVVFEPNTANTWVRVRTMIENFLIGLWRDGGLAGATPDDAFFVKVGLGETMSPQDVLEGRLIVEIGMAAVRPAEFIILRFMHKLQES
jgi:uncharacterized protein